ncbi:MAG: Mini-ribonuclease 3 [Clostridia bacterium]|nr:Mini-ribonuclease 3 [Clostridia bacterium]
MEAKSLTLREETPMAIPDARMLNPLQLAYIGDTVWDLLIRSRIIYRRRSPRHMHKDAVACVNAHAQTEAMRRIEAVLTQEESDVYRRGRNAHTHHAAPKNQDVADYRAATGLEALVGFLYLTGQEERLLHLFKISQEENTDAQV